MKPPLLRHSAFLRCSLWLLAISLCEAQPTTANLSYHVSVKHLTTEQGVPTKQVLTVGQDRQGFIWIGTLENAFRFDGNRFVPLPALKQKQKLRSFSPVFSAIATDRQGNLWLCGPNVAGLQEQLIIRPGQNQPQPVGQAFGDSTLFKRDPFNGFIPTANGSYQYVRTRSGTIWKLTGQGGIRAVFQHPDIANPRLEHTLYETDRQTLLFVSRPKPDSKQWVLLEIDSLGRQRRQQTLPFWVKPIGRDAKGAVYFFRRVPNVSPEKNVELYQLDASGVFSKLSFQLDARQIHNPNTYSYFDIGVTYDSQKELFWITGPGLVLAWHAQQGMVFNLGTSGLQMRPLPNCTLPFIDRTGTVWIATSNGILLLNAERTLFQRYLHVPESQVNVASKAIRGMMQVGHQLWVNTNVCEQVDLQTGASRPILQHPIAYQGYTMNLYPVVQQADGTIWAAALDLIRVNPKTYQFTPYSLSTDNPTVSMWTDGSNRLWLGRENGLLLFDTRLGKAEPFSKYNQYGELAKSRINGFFPEKRAEYVAVPRAGRSSRVWLATSSGLYLLDTLRGIIDRYSPQDTGSHRIPFGHITFVYPDPENVDAYWLATRGGGLLYWNHKTGQSQPFTTKQGLSDNTLYAIYEDKYQRLWLPSNYGLMSFHRKTHQVQIYHTKDGIADEEFNLMAHFRAPDGRLFLGGLNGITAFYPDQIKDEKPIQAPLLVAQYQKLNAETGQMVSYMDNFQQAKKIALTAADRLFSLSFALLDYRQPGQFRLWYRIKDWQEKWVMQEQPELRINGLPAGEYTLEVRAQTIDGNWASSIVSVPITVAKPVYLRAWFLISCLLMLIGAVAAVFRWRNKQLITDRLRLEAEVARRTEQIERQTAELQANATLKARFFANVSHEFRTPLTLLLGPLQYVAKRVNDSSARQLLAAMERNANQLLGLVNDILDLTRLDTHTLQLQEQPGDLSQVMEQITTTFLTQAQYAGIHLYVSGHESPCLMMLDTQRIEAVMRNLLANALRHTPAGGQIRINIHQSSTEAVIEIADTGSGIHPEDLPHIFERYFQTSQPDKPLQGGTGIGLALCLEYCKLWGGSLTVNSELGQGSTFRVSYPIRAFVQDKELVLYKPTSSLSIALPIQLQGNEDMQQKPATDKTLMVVDDNPDMLLYIQTLLTPYYTLVVAENGRKALNLLEVMPQNQLPSLVISDIMMPEVDGLTLVNELRTNSVLRHIPVILLTARVDLESRLQALKLGVADYLAKPFSDLELITRIQNLLHRVEEQSTWVQEVDETNPIEEKDEWIQWVQQTIRQNLNNDLFGIKTLAEMANLSERQLNRRIKVLTGLSPSQLIQEIRLQVAYDLFEKQPDAMVKTVAYHVGYQKASYFSQLYRERFGVHPEERSCLLSEVGV